MREMSSLFYLFVPGLSYWSWLHITEGTDTLTNIKSTHKDWSKWLSIIKLDPPETCACVRIEYFKVTNCTNNK